MLLACPTSDVKSKEETASPTQITELASLLTMTYALQVCMHCGGTRIDPLSLLNREHSFVFPMNSVCVCMFFSSFHFEFTAGLLKCSLFIVLDY